MLISDAAGLVPYQGFSFICVAIAPNRLNRCCCFPASLIWHRLTGAAFILFLIPAPPLASLFLWFMQPHGEPKQGNDVAKIRRGFFLASPAQPPEHRGLQALLPCLLSCAELVSHPSHPHGRGSRGTGNPHNPPGCREGATAASHPQRTPPFPVLAIPAGPLTVFRGVSQLCPTSCSRGSPAGRTEHPQQLGDLWEVQTQSQITLCSPGDAQTTVTRWFRGCFAFSGCSLEQEALPQALPPF